MAGLGAARTVQRNEVGLGHQVIQIRAEHRAGLCLHTRRGPVARVIEDAHAQAVMRLARGRLGDPPKADQAQHAAGDLGSDHVGGPPADPLARPHMPLALAGPARRHQHQEDRQLGGGVCQHVRRVDHHQPPPAAGLEVDVVHPHPEVAEDPRRARALLQHRRVQGIRYGRADSVVAAQGLGDGRGVHGLIRRIQGDVVLPGEVALDVLGPAAGEQHFRTGHGSDPDCDAAPATKPRRKGQTPAERETCQGS